MSIRGTVLTIFCVGIFTVGVLVLLLLCAGATEYFNVVQIVGTYYFGLGIALAIIGVTIPVIRHCYREYEWSRIEARVKR